MTEYQFTISAVFEAETESDAWEQWRDWLTQRRTVEDGTEVVELPPVGVCSTCGAAYGEMDHAPEPCEPV